jgi:hypothetical protein
MHGSRTHTSTTRNQLTPKGATAARLPGQHAYAGRYTRRQSRSDGMLKHGTPVPCSDTNIWNCCVATKSSLTRSLFSNRKSLRERLSSLRDSGARVSSRPWTDVQGFNLPLLRSYGCKELPLYNEVVPTYATRAPRQSITWSRSSETPRVRCWPLTASALSFPARGNCIDRGGLDPARNCFGELTDASKLHVAK